MCYVITEGNNYIKHDVNGIRSVSDIKQAQKFDEIKAYNVLKSLPNTLKIFDWRVVQYVESDKEPHDAKYKVELSDDLEFWINNLKETKEKLQEYIKRKEILSNEHSIIEKEIIDLEHYIEFGKFNACEGYKATAMMQERLKKRRMLKDELFAIGLVISIYPNLEKITNAEKSINGLDNRLYRPRVLQELFA